MGKLYTNRGQRWEQRNSLWIVFTFLPFAITSFVSFLFIAVRLKNKKWAIYSMIYFAAMVVAFTIPSTEIGAMIALFTWIFSIIHAFKIRPVYLIELDVLKEIEKEHFAAIRKQAREKYMNNRQTPQENMSRENSSTKKQAARQQNFQQEEKERAASSLFSGDAQSNSAQASAQEKSPTNEDEQTEAYAQEKTKDNVNKQTGAGLGTDANANADSASNANSKAEGGEQTTATASEKLDLNKATVEEIAAIPAIGLILAKRIVAKRNELGGFDSFDHFIKAVGLKPHTAEKLKTQITFSPIKKPTKRGRIIDY